MKKISLFMHVTLDGFVAGPNNEMDWIKVNEEIFDLAGERAEEADTALYGRVTFEMMQGYWPTAGDNPEASKHDKDHSRWYNQVSKIVVSKSWSGRQLPGVTIVGDNVGDRISKFKENPGKGLVIFGSARAAQELMKHNLIDDYWLMVNPVALGTGKPLFPPSLQKMKLQFVSSIPFECGVVGLHYSK